VASTLTATASHLAKPAVGGAAPLDQASAPRQRRWDRRVDGVTGACGSGQHACRVQDERHLGCDVDERGKERVQEAETREHDADRVDHDRAHEILPG